MVWYCVWCKVIGTEWWRWRHFLPLPTWVPTGAADLAIVFWCFRPWGFYAAENLWVVDVVMLVIWWFCCDGSVLVCAGDFGGGLLAAAQCCRLLFMSDFVSVVSALRWFLVFAVVLVEWMVLRQRFWLWLAAPIRFWLWWFLVFGALVAAVVVDHYCLGSCQSLSQGFVY
jgi:hypothetical protein